MENFPVMSSAQFLCGNPLPLALTILYSLFSNDLGALGTNVFYTVIMKSVILLTLTSSGSLPIVIYQKEEAEAGGGGEKEGGAERKGE